MAARIKVDESGMAWFTDAKGMTVYCQDAGYMRSDAEGGSCILGPDGTYYHASWIIAELDRNRREEREAEKTKGETLSFTIPTKSDWVEGVVNSGAVVPNYEIDYSPVPAPKHFREVLHKQTFYTAGIEGEGKQMAMDAIVKEGRSVAAFKYARWPICPTCKEECSVIAEGYDGTNGKTVIKAVMMCR